MRLTVQHSLQLYDPEDVSLAEADAIVLPVAEAQAVIGETVSAFLARVAWRFDLPTVCRIGDEYYGRAEWSTRHLTANDNLAFVSRPLGGGSGGSTAKTIGSVVALIALTALAPYAVAGLGITALGTTAATLTFAGQLAAATIIGAGAIPAAPWLTPKPSRWRALLRTARDSVRGVLGVAGRFWRHFR